MNIKLQHFSSGLYSHKERKTHKSHHGGNLPSAPTVSPVRVSLCCWGIKTALEPLGEPRLKMLPGKWWSSKNQHSGCGFKGLYRVLHFLSNGTKEKTDDADEGKDKCCKRVKFIPFTMGLCSCLKVPLYYNLKTKGNRIAEHVRIFMKFPISNTWGRSDSAEKDQRNDFGSQRLKCFKT